MAEPIDLSKPTGSKPLRRGVIVACRRHDGRWLLVRRAATVERAPGKVGFPGGEVEAGETDEQAVVREMQEELSLAVRPLRPFWQSTTDVPGFLLHGWLAQIVGAPAAPNPIDAIQPDPREVAEVLWLTSDEAAAHPDRFTGNAVFVAALLAAVGG